VYPYFVLPQISSRRGEALPASLTAAAYRDVELVAYLSVSSFSGHATSPLH